jgi:hypothetical protein
VVRPAWVKVDTSRVAESQSELRRLWRELEIDAPEPKVDFARYLVIVFSERDGCEGGRGGAELEGLFVHDDGSYEPAYAPVVGDYCYEHSNPSSGVVYAVAVRRDRLPTVQRLRLATPRVPRLVPLRAAGAPKPLRCAPSLPPEPGPGDDSPLTIPERGQVSLQYLRDERPVFVVRHHDDTVDVLAGDVRSQRRYPGTSLAIEGLRDVVHWRAAEGRFWSSDGSYDEYGVPANPGAVWRSLDRYQATRIDDRTLSVARHARQSGYAPRPVLPAPRNRHVPRATVTPPVLGSEILVPYDWTVNDLQLGLPDA